MNYHPIFVYLKNLQTIIENICNTSTGVLRFKTEIRLKTSEIKNNNLANLNSALTNTVSALTEANRDIKQMFDQKCRDEFNSVRDLSKLSNSNDRLRVENESFKQQLKDVYAYIRQKNYVIERKNR